MFLKKLSLLSSFGFINYRYAMIYRYWEKWRWKLLRLGALTRLLLRGWEASKCSAFPRPRNPLVALTLLLLGMFFPSDRKLIIVNIHIS